jgi:hypothetical protein
VRHAVFLPPFDDFADPRRLVDLAIAAEESGWDGFFLWDHVLRWPGHEGQVGDTWTALAAVATRTSRIRIGPHITPIARGWPHRFARAAPPAAVGRGLGQGRPRPLKRAARLDGLFPAEGTPDKLGPMLDVIAAERGTLDGFDVALPAFPGSDMEAFERAGATWALWHFYPPAPADDIMKAVSAGPAARSG